MAKKPTKTVPETAESVMPVENAPATASVEPVQLTISDLQILARIVDLASRRGAFQAAELSQVGEAYNKLTGFLSYVESVQQSEEKDTVETSTNIATAE